MDYVNFIMSLIDMEAIKALDLKIKGPGLLIAGFFVLRAFRSIFTFSPITLVMSLAYAVVVVVILSNWGGVIEQIILPMVDQQIQQNAEPASQPDTQKL